MCFSPSTCGYLAAPVINLDLEERHSISATGPCSESGIVRPGPKQDPHGTVGAVPAALAGGMVECLSFCRNIEAVLPDFPRAVTDFGPTRRAMIVDMQVGILSEVLNVTVRPRGDVPGRESLNTLLALAASDQRIGAAASVDDPEL